MLSFSKRNLIATGLALSLLALTGCSQSQNYAADKVSGTYIAVPKGWHKIEKSQLNSAESKSTAAGAEEKLANVVWQEAYSTSPEVTASEVLKLQAPKEAIVYVRVRDLNYDEMNSVSYNNLRNLIVPITTWLEDPAKADSKFVLLDDYERVEKVARGVRTIYTFSDSAGISETVDQTALVAEDRSRIYVLIVRAESNYYKKHAKILQAIGDSFTVRGDK
jgi:hypothetical protein